MGFNDATLLCSSLMTLIFFATWTNSAEVREREGERGRTNVDLNAEVVKLLKTGDYRDNAVFIYLL